MKKRTSVRLRILDYFSTHSGRNNSLGKNQLIIMDQGREFYDKLNLTKAEDREKKEAVWGNVKTAISVINRTSNVVKIDSDKFSTEDGDIRKWFSIDRAKDDLIAESKKRKMSISWSKSADRFKEHSTFIEPVIQDVEELQINFEKE